MFFTFLGRDGSDQTLSQAAPYAHICYQTQHHCCHQQTSLPTNITHPTPLTPTVTTQHSQPPLMSPTTSSCHHRGIGGWRQWGASVVGGDDGWHGGKTSEFFFVPNELKSQKNVFFCFFSSFGGWVVGSEANVEKSKFFLTLP